MKYYDVKALGLQVYQGTGEEVICLCPFHNDNTPSSSFNIRKGVLYCHTCGKGFSAKEIARETGGTVELTDKAVVLSARRKTDSADFEWLSKAPLALNHPYLAKRGVSNKIVRRFEIRQTPFGVGVVFKDQRGRVKGGQIRQTNKLPRYLTFGHKMSFWPYYRKADVLFIVEGIFGVFRAAEFGIKAITTIGAGNITPGLISYARMFNSFVLFDDDEPGYVGAAKIVDASYGQIKALIPGRQADELTQDEWLSVFEEGRIARTAEKIIKLTDISRGRTLKSIRRMKNKWERQA